MSDADPSLDGPPWEEDAPDADVVERDPDTDDMFGAPEPAGMREAEAAAQLPSQQIRTCQSCKTQCAHRHQQCYHPHH